MPTAIPFTVSSSLDFSPDGVAPTCPRSDSASGNFDDKDDDQLNIAGAGTVSLTLKGTAKVLRLKVDAGATAPVNFIFNGGAEEIEVSAGGHIQYFNPSPSVGITLVDIVTTAAAVVSLVALS